MDFSALQVPPLSNWQDFESLCCDLWRAIWKDPNAMKNGRSGQKQQGVDIYGRPDQGNLWAAVQCKGKDNYTAKEITGKELLIEVEKAKSFVPPLSEWIIATSGQKDATVEQLARELTVEHLKKGLFSVHVWGWRDIVERLADFPEIIEKYYPTLSKNTTTSSKHIDEIKETTQGILENSAGIYTSLSTLTQDLPTILSQKSNSSTGITSSDIQSVVLTTEYQAEIDYARDLLNSFKYKDCIEYLERLKSRIWTSAPSIVKFRLLTNIGAAKFKLDQDEEAARLFLEAVQYNPDDEKALTNAALGYSLLRQFAESRTFIQKVLEKNPANINAYCLLVQLPDPQKTLENSVAKVPEAYRNFPEVAYALGLIARSEGKFSDAQFWFETAIRNDKEMIADIRGSLGTLLMEVLQERQYVVSGEQLNDAQRTQLSEAIHLLTEAWERVANTDLQRRSLAWIVNRGIAKKLLGDLDGAIKDVEVALEEEPSNPIFIKHRAVLAFLNNDSKQAIALLRGILQSKETPEAALIFADILQQENRTPEAINALQEILNSDVPRDLKENAKRVLIQAYLNTREFENAKSISDEMRAANPTEILNLVDAAKIARKSDNTGDAISLLAEAKSYINGDVTYSQLLALGDEFYALKQFGDSIDIYEKIANKNIDTPLTRRILNSYYRFGKLTQALEICRNLRSSHGPLPFITHTESAIYEEINDLTKAREVCQVYLQAFPNDPEMELRLAVVNLRSKNYDELDKFLDSSPDVHSLPLEHGLQLAHLYSVRGKIKECFNTIYEIRRAFYNRSESHLEYVRLFFEKAKGSYEWLGPQKIDVDVAVCVEDVSGKKEWFVIESRKDADYLRREINLDHPLAQRLRGKTVGEEIVIKEGLHSGETGKIVEFKSKYVYALHETFDVYEKMFPGVGGLWMVHVGEPTQPGEMSPGFKDVLESVSRQQERGNEIDQYYKDGKLTIGAIASLLNTDVFKVWNSLISNPEIGVRCSRGNIEERDRAFALLSTTKPKLVIDPISLLTIHSLEVSDIIIALFGKLLIAQTTIESLHNFIRERGGLERQGFMSIGKEGERFVRQEITAEDVKQVIEYFEKMIGWIEENCEVVPIKGALDIPREQKELMAEMLGAPFLDTVLISTESGNILFSDDERLRTFAKSEFDVDGIWTQILLMFALNENAIEKSRYTEATLNLVCSHYYHTGIDADILIEGAKKAGWMPTYPYTVVLRLLGSDRCNEASALNVSTSFLYELWKQPALPERRDYLIYELLNVITTGRDRRRVLTRLKRMIRRRFLLLPIEENRIISIIELWQRLHLM